MEKNYESDMSVEQLQGLLQHVEKRYAEAQTELDRMYWSWRIRDISRALTDKSTDSYQHMNLNEE